MANTLTVTTHNEKSNQTLIIVSGIFSKLLEKLNYDEEDMMAEMGGHRLYRLVKVFTRWVGIPHFLIIQCFHPLRGKGSPRQRTGTTFSQVAPCLSIFSMGTILFRPAGSVHAINQKVGQTFYLQGGGGKSGQARL